MADDPHAAPKIEYEVEHDIEGKTPAAWTAVTIVCLGFLIGSIAVVLAEPWLFFVSVGIVILGGIVGKVMQMMGLGATPAATPGAE